MRAIKGGFNNKGAIQMIRYTVNFIFFLLFETLFLMLLEVQSPA